MNIISKSEAISLGLKKYFTGIPCKNGHVSERYLSGSCKSCVESHLNKVRSENPDIHRIYSRKRREKFKDEINSKNRERYENDTERYKAYQKKYRDANKDKLPKIRKKSYAKHADTRRYESALWARNNRDIVNERKRKSYKIDPIPSLSQHQKRRAAKLNRTVAWYSDFDDFCIIEAKRLCRIREKLFGFKWHVDHIIPLRAKEASGLHYHKNIQVIPAHLNCSKSNQMIFTSDLEWI